MEMMQACASDTGDALYMDPDGGNGGDDFIDDLGTADVNESANNTFTFTLKEGKMARDANDDGVVDVDDFTVVIDGDELDAITEYLVGVDETQALVADL